MPVATPPKPVATPPKPLSPKRERFALEVSKGESLTSAYRTAYDCAKASNACVRVEASRLAALAPVEARIAELRSRIADEVVATKEEALLII